VKEEALHKLGYPGPSVFRPSLLLGARNDFRPQEELAKYLNKYLGFLIPKKYKPIDAAVVASAMIKIAREERNGFHIFESDEIHSINNNNYKIKY